MKWVFPFKIFFIIINFLLNFTTQCQIQNKNSSIHQINLEKALKMCLGFELRAAWVVDEEPILSFY